MNIQRVTTAIAMLLIAACSGEKETQVADIAAAKLTVKIEERIPSQSIAVGGSMAVFHKPGASFASPLDESWVEFAASEAELTLAPPVHQSINLRYEADTPPLPIKVQAATDNERLYIRLRWQDSSQNAQTSRSEFADGAAVQFALEGGAATSFMMGAANAPVNIWYWKAGSDQPQNLAAGGFGSTTALEQNNLEATAQYLDAGEWALVLSRPLQAEGDHQVDLSALAGHFSLAVWQGEETQRDGLKHVTMGWLNLEAAP